MAQKAIEVTSSNRSYLQERFFKDGPGVPMTVGYWVLAGFGPDGDYDMLSGASFHRSYTLGDKLRNGFYQAIPK